MSHADVKASLSGNSVPFFKVVLGLFSPSERQLPHPRPSTHGACFTVAARCRRSHAVSEKDENGVNLNKKKKKNIACTQPASAVYTLSVGGISGSAACRNETERCNVSNERKKTAAV